MFGKSVKKVRKEIKNLLKQRTMENEQKVVYSFKHLETYIQLSVFLTGKKPEKIELVEGFYNWYTQEVFFQAETLGLNPGFKDEKITFMGVPLEKKVTITMPTNGKVIS